MLLFFLVLSVVFFLPSALIDINWLFVLPYTIFVDWLIMSLVILVTEYKLMFIVQVYSTCWRFMVHKFTFSKLKVILYHFLYSIKALEYFHFFTPGHSGSALIHLFPQMILNSIMNCCYFYLNNKLHICFFQFLK